MFVDCLLTDLPVCPDEVADFNTAERDVIQEEPQEASHTESSLSYVQDESDNQVGAFWSSCLLFKWGLWNSECDNLSYALHFRFSTHNQSQKCGSFDDFLLYLT